MSIQPPQLAQVAIVVRDIEKAKAHYASLFGCEVPGTIVTAPGLEVNQTYQGDSSDARCKLAFFDVGNGVQLELIEPMGGKSSWQEALDEKGEGLHHIAFWVTDGAGTRRLMKSHGYELSHRGDMGDGEFVYYKGQDGVFVETLQSVRDEG